MAQIRVEAKQRGLAWLWSIIALLIAAALVWYLTSERRSTSGGDVVPPSVRDSSRDSGRGSTRPPVRSAVPVVSSGRVLVLFEPSRTGGGHG